MTTTAMSKMSRWIIGAMLILSVVYAAYLSMILFGVHVALIRNDSESEVLVSPSVAKRPLARAFLKSHQWTVRWASVRNEEGDMRIGCAEFRSALKNEYGIDYVTFDEFLVEIIEIDGCHGIRTAVTE